MLAKPDSTFAGSSVPAPLSPLRSWHAPRGKLPGHQPNEGPRY